MPEDFTKLIEDALEGIENAESVDRKDAASDGESGSVLITMEDGRTFLVEYRRVNPNQG